MITPTRGGIALILAGLVAVALGRIFGSAEPYYLGAMALIASFLSWLYLLTVRLKLTVTRTVSPGKVRAGSPIRIDLGVNNSRAVPTPILRIDDRIADGDGPSIHVAPIGSRQSANVAYRMPAQGRGHLALGPLTITTSDPFNLWQSSIDAGRSVGVVVRPELVDLGSMRAHSGYDPEADEQLSRSVSSSGDEFYALRPYVFGDELKRVNWRATARLNDLIVRQDEMPKTGRATLILDLKADVYSTPGFERAISAASSVAHAGTKAEQTMEILSSDGAFSARITSSSELDLIEERLSHVDPARDTSLARILDLHLHHGLGGRLVLITGQLTPESADAISRAARSYEHVIPIVCEPIRSKDPALALANLVVHDGTSDLQAVWSAATARAPRRGT